MGLKAASAKGWPHHLWVPNVMKSGSLNLLEPSGPHQACYGAPLPLPLCDPWKNLKANFISLKWQSCVLLPRSLLPYSHLHHCVCVLITILGCEDAITVGPCWYVTHLNELRVCTSYCDGVIIHVFHLCQIHTIVIWLQEAKELKHIVFEIKYYICLGMKINFIG